MCLFQGVLEKSDFNGSQLAEMKKSIPDMFLA